MKTLAKLKFLFAGFCATSLALAWVVPCRGDTMLTFTGSGNDGGQGSGTNLSASVTFDLSGTDLKVTLQNTTVNSVSGSYQNADILTAVYWSSLNTLGATPVSAALGSGSSLAGTVDSMYPPPLGENWEYATGSKTYAGKAINQGIGSSGLDIFGSGNFAGASSNMLDGSGWGVISTSDTAPSDGALNTGPFIQDTVVFDLTVPSGTTLSDLTNVVIQFGTSSSEPSFSGSPGPGGPPPPPAVPEPASLTLLGVGAVSLLIYRRRFNRRGALA